MKWIFENRVYSSLEELKDKTFNFNNRPDFLFTEDEVLDFVDHFISATKREDVLTPKEYFTKKYQQKFDVGEGAESESEL